MPGWCHLGCQLATDYIAARLERAMHLREPFALQAEFRPSYPLCDSHSHPIDAAFFIVQLVEGMMALWTMYPPEWMGCLHGAQITSVIEKVGRANGEWAVGCGA